MMIRKADALHRFDSQRLNCREESLGLGDPGKCDDRPAHQILRRYPRIVLIDAVKLGADRKCRN